MVMLRRVNSIRLYTDRAVRRNSQAGRERARAAEIYRIATRPQDVDRTTSTTRLHVRANCHHPTRRRYVRLPACLSKTSWVTSQHHRHKQLIVARLCVRGLGATTTSPNDHWSVNDRAC